MSTVRHLVSGMMLFLAATAALHAKAPAWTKVSTPFFTLYAEMSEKRAMAWAEDFELFRSTTEKALSASPARLRPVLIVVFDTDKEMRPYLPLRDGKPEDLGAYVVTTSNGDGVVMTYRAASADRLQHQLYFGGTAWLLSGFERRPPPWLERGICEVFASTRVWKDKVEIGSANGAFSTWTAWSRIEDLDSFTKIDPGTLSFGTYDAATGHYCFQCWAVTHYLLLGKRWSHPEKLQTLFGELTFGRPLGDALSDVFDMSANEFLGEVNDYMEGGRFFVYKVQVDRDEVRKLLKGSTVDQAEVDAACGVLLAATGRQEAADGALGGALLAAPKNPQIHALRARVAAIRGDSDEALRSSEKAASLGSEDPMVWYRIGESMMRGADAGMKDGVPHLAPAVARRAALAFARSLNSYPFYFPAYDHIAELAPSLGESQQVLLGFLEQGSKLAPSDDLLVAGRGVLEMSLGQKEEGLRRLRGVVERASPDRPLAVAIARQRLAEEESGGH